MILILTELLQLPQLTNDCFETALDLFWPGMPCRCRPGTHGNSSSRNNRSVHGVRTEQVLHLRCQ